MKPGQLQLVRVEPGPGEAAVAVDRGLQVGSLPTPLSTPMKKVSTARNAPVCGASMWRSETPG